MRIRNISGNYYAYFYDRNRRPKEKSWPLRTSRKDVAWQKGLRLKELYDKGEFDPWTAMNDPLERLTVREAVRKWLESKHDLRESTIESYQRVAGAMLEHVPANSFVEIVQLKHLTPYLDDNSVAVATRRLRYRTLRAFFNWCQTNEHINTNPLDNYSPPKQGKKAPCFLTTQDLERLLQAIDGHIDMLKAGYSIDWEKYPQKVKYKDKPSPHVHYRDGDLVWIRDVILLAVSTGMRRGELCNLTWSMVDTESGFIHLRNSSGFQTKSGDERSIPLLGDAREIIHRLANENPNRKPTDPVLTSTRGRITADRTTRLFKLLVRLAKLDERLHFHSLRHTTASWLVQKGVPMPMISHLLGHSSTAVTESFYAHLTDESVRDVLETALSRNGTKQSVK